MRRQRRPLVAILLVLLGFFETSELHVSIVLLVAGVWWINLFNFMDGIDWMTVCEVVPLAGGLAAIGFFGALNPADSVMAVALLGGLIAFEFLLPVVAPLVGVTLPGGHGQAEASEHVSSARAVCSIACEGDIFPQTLAESGARVASRSCRSPCTARRCRSTRATT